MTDGEKRILEDLGLQSPDMQPIVEVIMGQMKSQIDDGIYNAVQEYGINVDKERLLQALNDARAFWHEGYEAGKRGQPAWISVDERLPEEWREPGGNLINYLIFMPECGVDVGNYAKPVKTWLCVGIPCKVTHWMTLPKPPEV